MALDMHLTGRKTTPNTKTNTSLTTIITTTTTPLPRLNPKNMPFLMRSANLPLPLLRLLSLLNRCIHTILRLTHLRRRVVSRLCLPPHHATPLLLRPTLSRHPRTSSPLTSLISRQASRTATTTTTTLPYHSCTIAVPALRPHPIRNPYLGQRTVVDRPLRRLFRVVSGVVVVTIVWLGQEEDLIRLGRESRARIVLPRLRYLLLNYNYSSSSSYNNNKHRLHGVSLHEVITPTQRLNTG